MEPIPSCTADTRPSTLRYRTLSAPVMMTQVLDEMCKTDKMKETDVAELTNVSSNVTELWLVGYELFFGRYVNAHVTGESYRWRGNSDMDLLEGAA